MSYESKLNERSGRLVNPAQLCMLLSIAFHLLILKFGLPTIRFNNDSGKREVSIVQLNPEQQSRLPDLYPQLQTPEVPAPDLSQLPEADLDEPAAPFAIPPSLIPGIGDSATLPPLTIPPPPQFDIPELPPMTDITLPPVGDLSDLPLPPDLDPSDFKPNPIKLPPNIGKVPEPTLDSNLTQKPKPPAKTPATSAQPKPQPSAEPKPKPEPKLTPEQIAARREAAFQERIKKMRQSVTKTEAGTTDEDARKNYVAWLAKVQDIEPDQIEIEGTYPRDACIRRLKGSSVFGVVVNARGEVVALDLIKGAKYPIFNQQGSRDLGERTLNNETERPKPYQVKVNYEYDSEICPSLTLPSIRRTEEKQQEAETKPQPTTPQPEVPSQEAQPEPEVQPEPKPEFEAQPESKPETEPKPESKPESEAQPESKPETKPKPEPEPKPLPSLRDRLRDIPLPDRRPSDLKDAPLPERPNFGK